MEPVDANVYARDCPSRVVLDRIGDRWTALIVGVLEDGPRRFTEIRDAMGITPKVLTETLRALERDGLVVRRASADFLLNEISKAPGKHQDVAKKRPIVDWVLKYPVQAHRSRAA